MMQRSAEETLLEKVTAVAQSTDAPPMERERARGMARRAAAIAGARRKTRSRAAVAGAFVAVAAAAAGFAFAFATQKGAAPDAVAHTSVPAAQASSPAPSADPMEVALPTGDRLTAVEGSQFELLSVSEMDRRVSLSHGAMLFDVAPLAGEARFEVETEMLTVRVRGTVFSVRADESGTTVRVYEGRVEIVRGDETHVLDAGESFGAGSEVSADPRLALAGQRAAAARVESRAEAPVEESAAAVVLNDSHALAESSADETPVVTRHALEPAGGATIETTRALIASGDAAGALVIARERLALSDTDWAFRLVEADALRALRRDTEAADAYDRAAAEATPAARRGAGYRAALIRFERQQDAAGALESLDAARVDESGSLFEERGLALRTRALLRAGRDAEARRAAALYLSRHPAGTTRAFMQQVVNGGG